MLFAFGVLASVILLGIMFYPFRHLLFAPTSRANCLPIRYEDDTMLTTSSLLALPQPYVPHVHRTVTSLAVVKQFYDEILNVTSTAARDNYGEGRWSVTTVRADEHLYECSAAMNWEEVERGCIYIRTRDEKTVIETIWLYSATAVPLCQSYLGELPE